MAYSEMEAGWSSKTSVLYHMKFPAFIKPEDPLPDLIDPILSQFNALDTFKFYFYKINF